MRQVRGSGTPVTANRDLDPTPTEPWRETSQPGIRRLALEATRAAIRAAKDRRTTVNPEGARP
jgi:hypothetical protein